MVDLDLRELLLPRLIPVFYLTQPHLGTTTVFLRQQPPVLEIFKGAVRDPSKPVWDTGVFFSLFLGHSLPDLVGGFYHAH